MSLGSVRSVRLPPWERNKLSSSYRCRSRHAVTDLHEVRLSVGLKQPHVPVLVHLPAQLECKLGMNAGTAGALPIRSACRHIIVMYILSNTIRGTPLALLLL